MGRLSAWIRVTALFAAIFVAVALCPSASHGADPNDIYWIPDRNLYGTGLVDAVLIDGENAYFGGSFNVRNTNVRDCAHWDGTTWTSLGGAVGTQQMGLVHVIVRSGEDFYIAGMFDEVSTIIPAGNIARWDGRNWDVMNLGTNQAVRAVAIAPNGDVYAGGEFTSAGGVPGTRGIARWDGTRWHSVGGSVNNHVNAVLIDGDDIYVGGRFSQAGGKDIKNLARFDGTDWYPVGSGVDGFVNTFSKRGNRLIVGGGFREAGGWTVNGIATWNGTNWRALGTGISGPGFPRVRAIAHDEDYIYVGGFFTYAGGQPANYIARWDGEEWTAMGSGLGFSVKSLLVDGDKLIVTGEFTEAGLKRSNLIARWVQPYVVFRDFLGTETETGDGFGLTWKARLNGKVDGFNVYRKAADEGAATLVGNMLAPGVRSFVDNGYESGKTYTYTLAAVKRSGVEILAAEEVTYESPAAHVSYPFGLSQNYPNPFNPRTTIEFTLPEESHVELVVFDVRGNQVKKLLDEVRPGGINVTDWNGTNDAGTGVPTGIYFYRMTWGSTVETRKMILMK